MMYDGSNEILDKIDRELYQLLRAKINVPEHQLELAFRRAKQVEVKRAPSGSKDSAVASECETEGLLRPPVDLIYNSETDHSASRPAHRDLDSDAARQSDRQYKHILQSKTQRVGPIPARPQDLESQITDELLLRLKHNPGSTNQPPRSSALVRKMSDRDSVRTEDIEREFHKTLIHGNAQPMPSNGVKPMRATLQPLTNGAVLHHRNHSPDVKFSSPHNHGRTYGASDRKVKGRGDKDSVKTEDFENHFQQYMVKQVGGVPVTSFDPMLVDSDIDTVRSQVVRQKLKAVLHALDDDRNQDDRDDEEYEEDLLGASENNSEQHWGNHTFPANNPSSSLQRRDSWPRRQERFPVNPGANGLDLGSEEERMERESAAVRHEIETDPRHRSLSPQHRAGYNPITKSLLPNYGYQVSPGASNDQAQKDLHVIQQKLARGRLEVKKLEGQLKENRKKGEEARTELLLAEFKRDSARKELEQVLQQIHSKRSQLRDIEEELEEEETQQRGKETTQQALDRVTTERDSLQLQVQALEEQLQEMQGSKSQVSDLMDELEQEKNVNRQALDRIKEEMASKETRFAEIEKQKETSARENEERHSQVVQLTAERDSLMKQLDKWDHKFKQLERDKNTLLKEKSQEFDTFRSRLQEQMVQSRQQSTQELHEARIQVQSLTDELNEARKVQQASESKGQDLEDRLSRTEREKIEVSEERSTLHRTLATVTRDKDDAISNLKSAHEHELTSRLEALQAELTTDREEQLQDLETRLTGHIRDLEAQLDQRETEVQTLHERLQHQQSLTESMPDRIRAESQEKFVALLKDEKNKWQREKEREVNQVVNSMRDELERSSTRLREEINKLTQEKEEYRLLVEQLRQEVEDVKESSRQMYRDKLAALNQAKEQVEQEKEKEIESMKEKLQQVTSSLPMSHQELQRFLAYKQETQKSMEKLRENLRRAEEEAEKMRAEKLEQQTKDRQNDAETDRWNRQLTNELNEETRRMVHALGRHGINISTWDSTPPGAYFSRTGVTQSVANLQLVNDEARKHLQQMIYDCDAAKQQANQLCREKSSAIEDQRQKMQEEKLQALESLKNRLIKEHLEEVDKLHKCLGRDKSLSRSLREKDKELREIQSNLSNWKERTSDKLASKFQEELTKQVEHHGFGMGKNKDVKRIEREWQREKASLQREMDRLHRANQQLQANAHLSSFITPSPGDQTLTRLQKQVQQLQEENEQMRRSRPRYNGLGGSMSFSHTDLSQAGKTSSSNDQLEKRCMMAEERAIRSESQFKTKLSEVTRLQSCINQQSKELMQLQRAYNNLQNKGIHI